MIRSKAAAARLMSVTPPTITAWIRAGWLQPTPPWSEADLATAKARRSNSGPPMTAEHGTTSRYRGGCRCRPCGRAHVAQTNARVAARRRRTYTPEKLAAVAASLAAGMPYTRAVLANGLSVQGLGKWLYQHPHDRAVIDHALRAGRDPAIAHGTHSGWRAGCRCPECRATHRGDA